MYKQQPLIRGRGVSYCKNLLSPRFELSEGISTFSNLDFSISSEFQLLELIANDVLFQVTKVAQNKLLIRRTMFFSLLNCVLFIPFLEH